MKKTLLLVLIFSSFITLAQISVREVGNLVIDNIPEIPKSLSEKLNQYQNTRGASFNAWLPDGNGMIISTRFGETNQLHKITHPEGARHQITFFGEPLSNAKFPHKTTQNTFFFTKDIGGNEHYQLFSFDMNSGHYEMLTDGNSRNGGLLFSNKGKKMVFTSTRRNKKDYDFYVADTQNPKEAKLLASLEGSWTALDWSPDDDSFLAINYVSAAESYIWIFDVKTGEKIKLNPDKKVAYYDAFYAKNKQGIYILTDEESEFMTLKYYDLQKKTFKILTTFQWDIFATTMNEDGSQVAFATNENGFSKLYTLNTSTNAVSTLELPIEGVITALSFHPNKPQIAITLNSPISPADVYVINTSSKQWTRWTYSETGGLNPKTFIAPELIHFQSFDNHKIPAFYFKPKNKSKKTPVLISIHGGPESQYQPFFSPFFQYLLNETNIAVLAPNVRGSAGYGKNYLTLDNGSKREESVQDIGKLLDWIAKQPELDASQVIVYGGSYGGYMVLGSMTNFNDRLLGGVDLYGISNFVTFLEKTESYRRDLRRVEYGDEREPVMREHLQKISPLNNIKKVTKPMFIYQGLNDPRVPVGESEQMVKALRENGNETWYLLAKDEGHGLAKKTNRDFHTAATVLFLEKILKK